MTDPAISHDTTTHPIRMLRQNLAHAYINLRAAQDAHTIARAAAEREAIRRRHGHLGHTPAERQRALTLALLEDRAYTAVLAYLRDCQAAVDRIHAELAAACDARRAAEWHIRARLAAALARLGDGDDDPDPAGAPIGDNVIDFLLACQLIQQRTGAARVAVAEDGCCCNQQRSR